MNPIRKAYLQLHIAVLFFGFTAILGNDKLISIPAISIVWWRVLFTSVSLFFLINFGKSLRKIPKRYLWQYMVIGAIVALHWVCFFGSVKLAGNSSVTLVCMATGALFTALIEPLVLKTKFQKKDLLLGILVIPGMALVVGNVSSDMWLGIVVGLISAFLASVFSIWNKMIIDEADPKDITFLEMSSGWLFISCILPFVLHFDESIAFMPVGLDWIYLLLLALLCTTFAYVLSLRALKHLSAFASTLTFNLEPVYGILIAYFFLDEKLSVGFYLGVLIILGAVFLYPFMNQKKSPK
ncbi:MAG: drug/metabolite transporter (DMT)-like permease [Granulosicoccus sp.]|jgi:drug/metabolite transporter (DMT)-like permease